MRVGFVHDWLTVHAGSERVLDAMVEPHPTAPILTLIHDVETFRGTGLAHHEVRTSLLQRVPGATRRYRYLLPLMPLVVEQFDMGEFDVVVSNVKAVSHGVLTSPRQLHVAYVNRPMRYAWDLYQSELRDYGLYRGVRGALARAAYHYLRLWDHQAMQRPDVLVANSRFVRALIAKLYGRTASVLHPPVDIGDFQCRLEKDDHYVAIGRLVPYKRVDLIVRAFNELGLPLRIIGDGPQEERLRAVARPNIEFLGWLPRDSMARELERAKCLVFAAEEEFGIIAVEAQAAGTPVVALARGGATETVVPGETGLLFADQTPQSLAQAIRAFEEGELRTDSLRLREHAERFSRERFLKEFRELIDRSWERFGVESEESLRSGDR